MIQLQVKIPKLNIRKSPEVTADNFIGVLTEGTVFFVETALVGAEHKNINTWFRDHHNRFYWGGGVKIIQPSTLDLTTTISPQIFSWAHHLLEIPAIWNDMQAFGENIKVAVLDTGIDRSHTDLMDSIEKAKNFTGGDIDDVNDEDGHGTHCAGIIAARGKTAAGVAPKCRLYIGKVLNRGFQDLPTKNLVEALKWAMAEKVDIISMSLTCGHDVSLEEAVRRCSERGIILIAASGNRGKLKEAFPAALKQSVSVGAFDASKKRVIDSNLSKNLKFLAPGNLIPTTAPGNTTAPFGDTSAAAAFTSGVVALFLSYIKKRNIPVTPRRLMELFYETAADYQFNSIIGWDEESGFGTIDPKNTYSRIKDNQI